jgi:Lipocalin-like domain
MIGRLLGLSALTAVGLAATPVAAAMMNKAQLVGSWMLVANSNTTPNAKTFGPNDGIAIFDGSRFTIQLVRSDLPKFASNNRDNGTPDENKAVVQGSITYFGTYSVNDADGVLTLHIERSSFPNWNGTDQKRIVTSLSTDELKYTNPSASVGGTAELAWKRLK